MDTWPVHKQDNYSLNKVSGIFSICSKAQKAANTDWLIRNTQHISACGIRPYVKTGLSQQGH